MEILRELSHTGTIVPICSFLLVFGIIASIQWRKVRQAEIELPLKQQTLALKQQMVESGMSAGEIERVLKAQPTEVSA